MCLRSFSSLVPGRQNSYTPRGEFPDSHDRAAMRRKERKKMVSVPRSYRPKEGERFMNPGHERVFPAQVAGLERRAAARLERDYPGSSGPSPCTRRISPTAPRRRPTVPWLLRTRDRERKLISKIDAACAAWKTAPTVIARRPRNRSTCGAWRRGRSRRCPSKRRSATSEWNGLTGAIEPDSRVVANYTKGPKY